MINQENFLELMDLLASSSWTLFEVKAGELGIAYENLRNPLQQMKELPEKINQLQHKLSDEVTVSNNRKNQLLQAQSQISSLESELVAERETAQEALRTGQEKQELITQWSHKYQALISKWKASLQQELTLLRGILNHD